MNPPEEGSALLMCMYYKIVHECGSPVPLRQGLSVPVSLPPPSSLSAKFHHCFHPPGPPVVPTCPAGIAVVPPGGIPPAWVGAIGEGARLEVGPAVCAVRHTEKVEKPCICNLQLQPNLTMH